MPDYKRRDGTGGKLVFLDIDGTLMDGAGHIPPSALTACREARRQGNLLFICSGRPRGIISDAILGIGFDGVISSGGAHIEVGNTAADRFQGETIFDAAIPSKRVKEIAAYLDSQECGFSFENTDSIFWNRYFLTYWEAFLQRFRNTPQESFFEDRLFAITQNLLPDEPEDSYYEQVNKILFVQSGSISFAGVRQRFGGECEIFHGSLAYCGEEGGEIGPLGIHKGSALEAVARYYGRSLRDTFAFGDSDNDRPMLERAGIGIAMGNADAELKALAQEVTASLEEDGIFKGFQKHGLI